MIGFNCCRVVSFGRTCRFFGGGCGARAPPGAPCGGVPCGGFCPGGFCGGCCAAVASVTTNTSVETERTSLFMREILAQAGAADYRAETSQVVKFSAGSTVMTPRIR